MNTENEGISVIQKIIYSFFHQGQETQRILLLSHSFTPKSQKLF